MNDEQIDAVYDGEGTLGADQDPYKCGVQSKTEELIAETKELQRLLNFKILVHDFLDNAGVPVYPQGMQAAEDGCRVTQRLDWFLASRDALAARAKQLSRGA